MSDWKRLASYLVTRRVQLGHRSRPSFAEAAGISSRTLGDIETGRRTNFDPATIAAVENGLRWQRGSIRDVLDGGEPVTLGGREPAPIEASPRSDRDEALIRIMRSDLSDSQKNRIVELLIAERAAADRAFIERADQLIKLLKGADE